MSDTIACACCASLRDGYLWALCATCRDGLVNGDWHLCTRQTNIRPLRMHTSGASAWVPLTRVRSLTVEDFEAVLDGGLAQFHPANTREQARRVHALIQEASHA